MGQHKLCVHPPSCEVSTPYVHKTILVFIEYLSTASRISADVFLKMFLLGFPDIYSQIIKIFFYFAVV